MEVCLWLIDFGCCLIHPWILTVLWLTAVMAVMKLLYAGTIMSSVCSQAGSDHVLDEVPVPGRNDEGVMLLVREALLQRASGVHHACLSFL